MSSGMRVDPRTNNTAERDGQCQDIAVRLHTQCRTQAGTCHCRHVTSELQRKCASPKPHSYTQTKQDTAPHCQMDTLPVF